MTIPAHFIEIETDVSKFKTVFEELSLLFPDLPRDELLGVVRDGFKLQAKPAPGTKDPMTATFEPFDFLVELLPALRAGELSFCAFKSIVKTKSRVWFETCHD